MKREDIFDILMAALLAAEAKRTIGATTLVMAACCHTKPQAGSPLPAPLRKKFIQEELLLIGFPIWSLPTTG
jgi:hypothetical protein